MTVIAIERGAESRFPDEPYRQRFGFIGERLRRTRAGLTGGAAARAGGYPDAAALALELEELEAALVADGLERVAYGELADLRWQLGTFGFHLASLDLRQNADVHEQVVADLLLQADVAADYLARGILSLIGSPGRWNLEDDAQVRELVRDELLGGIER